MVAHFSSTVCLVARDMPLVQRHMLHSSVRYSRLMASVRRVVVLSVLIRPSRRRKHTYCIFASWIHLLQQCSLWSTDRSAPSDQRIDRVRASSLIARCPRWSYIWKFQVLLRVILRSANSAMARWIWERSRHSVHARIDLIQLSFLSSMMMAVELIHVDISIFFWRGCIFCASIRQSWRE